jgi:hypothetical protein
MREGVEFATPPAGSLDAAVFIPERRFRHV